MWGVGYLAGAGYISGAWFSIPYGDPAKPLQGYQTLGFAWAGCEEQRCEWAVAIAVLPCYEAAELIGGVVRWPR